MIGVLLATHGDFASGILNAVELIAGKQEAVCTVGLHHGDGVEDFEEKIRVAYEKLDTGEGVLMLVDILNGTPANMVMKLLAEDESRRAIAGMNMPMVIEAVTMRYGMKLDALAEEVFRVGTEHQVPMHERCREMLLAMDSEVDEEF